MICIGKVVNTHGIKGEIRIKSFYKEDAFYEVKNKLYINDIPYQILTYRKHKDYDMVTLEGICDINDALPFKGLFVYVKRDEVKKDFLLVDLIGKKVISKDKKGIVTKIENGIKYPYLIVLKDKKEYMIPYVPDIVTLKEDSIIIEVEGLLGED